MQTRPSRAEISVPDRHSRRDLLEVLTHAFRDNPMNRAIHGPDKARRLRANRAGLRALVLRPGESAEIRVFRGDGTVLGGFVVLKPGGFPLRNIKVGDQIGCLMHQGLSAMRLWHRVHQGLAAVHPIDRHWYLAVLGVAPWAWGRGVGGALLAELERLVLQEPAPIYLESDREESIRFYQGMGFRVDHEVDLLGVRCVCLSRAADFRGT
jgi:ribosomal protein S18 acetylase RimI-like enzyme